MKKVIALILVLSLFALSLVGCSKNEYYWGNKHLSFLQSNEFNILVKSNKLEFDINDVTLDLFYGFYCLDDETLDHIKDEYFFDATTEHSSSTDFSYEFVHAVYITNDYTLRLPIDSDKSRDDGWLVIDDYENIENAKLVKYINYDELFDTDYGYTTDSNKVVYNYSEKITIPADMFNSSSGCISIYIVRFVHDLETGEYLRYPTYELHVGIQFDLIDDNTVVFRER